MEMTMLVVIKLVQHLILVYLKYTKYSNAKCKLNNFWMHI